jgi:hypothetical protein
MQGDDISRLHVVLIIFAQISEHSRVAARRGTSGCIRASGVAVFIGENTTGIG